MIRRVSPRTWALLALVGAVLALYASGANHLLSVAQLKIHRDALLQFTAAHFAVTVLAAMSLYISLVALSAPVADVLTLLCGMLFGRWIGTVVVVVSASIGATLALLLIRYLAGDMVRERIHAYAKAKRFLGSFNQHIDSYLLFMRLVPTFPFWIVNIVLALSDITAWRFLSLTFIGIIPGSFVYTNVGASIGRMDSVHEMVSTQTLLALGLLALLSLLPMIIRQLMHRNGITQEGR